MKNAFLIIILFILCSCEKNKKTEFKIENAEKIITNKMETSNKKHPILPNKLTFQLQDKEGVNIRTENILCHLNVYIDSSSYHTYSFIPTNSSGIITLTKNQIIQNTELKHSYSEDIMLDTKPVKFDFFVMESSNLNRMINIMENYLKLDIESIKQDLTSRGFSKTQISLQINPIKEKMKEDKELYEFLKKNKNAEIDKSNGNIKISGIWNKETDYKYELK